LDILQGREHKKILFHNLSFCFLNKLIGWGDQHREHIRWRVHGAGITHTGTWIQKFRHVCT
jgi:hypothetical protein